DLVQSSAGFSRGDPRADSSRGEAPDRHAPDLLTRPPARYPPSPWKTATDAFFYCSRDGKALNFAAERRNSITGGPRGCQTVTRGRPYEITHPIACSGFQASRSAAPGAPRVFWMSSLTRCSVCSRRRRMSATSPCLFFDDFAFAPKKTE